ncbi:aldo/keto reductase [Occultella glacieicola]|uniref:Aldo/keto reductase n=1 Tax=Occultella glacieicola TaxID=2518684 RepID=A0ABY2E356_9MICO|nr:aldo/keto reductase [Occultella glacieicola]TDE94025.1 aldo/keto reductase [Occultella glacieicola]
MTSYPANVPAHSLSDGSTIPQLGFGVWQVPDDEATTAVAEALRVGYRLIDTAAAYGNEAGVGRAIAESGLARDEVYVTTKLNNPDQGYDSTLRAYDESLAKLGLETVDLYLIHWAAPAWDQYSATWKAFVTLLNEGRVRSIGVSNFQVPHLERIIGETGVTPVLNQVESHPYLQQNELKAFHAEHHIATEAWSPLGSGRGLLEDPVFAEIAAAHQATPAQVVLAWHLAVGNVVIPKSVTPSRIAENLAAADVRLTDDDLARIAGLDRGHRYGGDPDNVTWGKPAHLA